MRFATIGHLIDKNTPRVPKSWVKDFFFVTPEFDVKGAKGCLLGLMLTAQEIMSLPIGSVRSQIKQAVLYAQDNMHIDLIQLGALTTSVTEGGKWLAAQEDYRGFVNHGDSFTAAVTCQAAVKALHRQGRAPSDLTLSIVGAYGIIGEAVSKLLVPQFQESILIGRREKKLRELGSKLKGNFRLSTELITQKADVIITATSHPSSLLTSEHLKVGAIVIDVSQPPNLGHEVCSSRPDVLRIDGGYVEFPPQDYLQMLGMPKGKNFACIAEVVMQALEHEQTNHVGSIEMQHLKKTELWSKKYGFTLNDLTNFGTKIT